MSGQFGVTKEEMVAFANRMGEVDGNIKGQITALQNMVDGLAAGWKGRAAQAYLAPGGLQDRWNQDTQKLLTTLDQIRQAILSTANNYSLNDEEGAASSRSVAI